MSGGSDDTRVTLASNASPRADAGISDLHRVGPGESLRSIAQQYGISIDALKSANQINSDTVRAGTLLTIPPAESASFHCIAASGSFHAGGALA